MLIIKHYLINKIKYYNTIYIKHLAKMGIGKMMKSDVPDGIGKMQRGQYGIGKMHGGANEQKKNEKRCSV